MVGDREAELFMEGPYPEGQQGGYYALDVDPVSSEIYVADAIDFIQRGMVYRFTSSGKAIDSFQTGIGPGSFCFKP